MSSQLTQSDQERLSAWMDGELNPSEAENVARLVETDAAWSEAYRQLRALDQTLGAWDAPTPPADLADRVLAHARRKPEPVVLRVGRWMLSAAAVMLIGVGVWQYYAQKRLAPAGSNPTLARGTLAGVPESFVRDNAAVFQHMPENLPANGPYRIVITRPTGVATQPVVRVLSWNQLNPQQQQAVRRRAVIFLRLSPEQQVKLLQAHERALRAAKLHQRQINWLKPVIESFTREERARLLRMTPAQRGKMFLQRRNELLQSGKLVSKNTQDPETHTSPFLTSPSKARSEP
jgi:hypothetical protein